LHADSSLYVTAGATVKAGFYQYKRQRENVEKAAKAAFEFAAGYIIYAAFTAFEPRRRI
jgi:hypothetical protein